MPFPSFNENGDLPFGIHSVTLSETLKHFGIGSRQRQILATRLERIHRLALSTGKVSRFVVFGSFITAKEEPNDVDVFLLMEDAFDLSTLTGEAHLLFSNHAVAQARFGASVFWIRRLAALDGEEKAMEDWQVKRDGGKRGIVEIIGEST
jgi:predicted nucleotidyltransferase